MKANQKGGTSPYDVARRSGSFVENFGTKDPRRKDAVLARSCQNVLLNPNQCRAAAGSKPLSRTQIAVAGMRDEHLVSSFVVGSVVVKNDI